MSYGERVLLATQTAILLVLVGKTVLQRLAHAILLARVATVETLVWAGLDKTDLAKSQARTAVHAAADVAEAVGRIEAKVSAPGDSGHALPAWRPGDTDRRQ